MTLTPLGRHEFELLDAKAAQFDTSIRRLIDDYRRAMALLVRVNQDIFGIEELRPVPLASASLDEEPEVSEYLDDDVEEFLAERGYIERLTVSYGETDVAQAPTLPDPPTKHVTSSSDSYFREREKRQAEGPWKCLGCSQVNDWWAVECGRCEAARVAPSTAPAVMAEPDDSVAPTAAGHISVTVVSKSQASVTLPERGLPNLAAEVYRAMGGTPETRAPSVLEPRNDEERIVYAEESLMVDFQLLVHELIERKGVSREELAMKLGVVPQWVDRLFLGDNVSLRHAARICATLGEEPLITTKNYARVNLVSTFIGKMTGKCELCGRGEAEHQWRCSTCQRPLSEAGSLCHVSAGLYCARVMTSADCAKQHPQSESESP